MSISLTLSDYFLVSFKQYLYYLLELFVLFVIVQTSLKSLEQIEKLFTVIALSLFFVAMIGLYENIT
ncbi:MAG: hypothetical protein ACYC25_11215, partial [Paludibacter sp.]